MAVAVLGAGILGTCTALELADRGHRVVLFERNATPLREASLYNEGKLHLGFVYAADRSFRTAEKMIRGTARFADILARWIPSAALETLPSRPFDYLVHRDTMVSVEDIESHFAQVANCLEEAGGAPGARDHTRPIWRPLTRSERASRYNDDLVIAAYETCEIALDTWALAEQLRAAVGSHRNIELVSQARVTSVEDRPGGGFDILFARDGERRSGPFSAVVNALWANRPMIDRRRGFASRGPSIIRYKLGVHVTEGVDARGVPSFTVMLGPFGDVVVYGNGRVYLSWYPACMIGKSTSATETNWAEVLAAVDIDHVRSATIRALADICPAIHLCDNAPAQHVIVNGGAIFALGETDIDDPQSRLHERFDVGIDADDGYFSVDTGKFTLGPAVALETADRVVEFAGARER